MPNVQEVESNSYVLSKLNNDTDQTPIDISIIQEANLCDHETKSSSRNYLR